MKCTVVIAARNEELTLPGVLEGVKPFTDDLIVVDGNSSDQTVPIAESFGARILKDTGKGKGEAVRLGIDAAHNPIVVTMDADGSHEPKDIPRLCGPIAEDRADLVIASRMLGGSDEFHGDIWEIGRMIGALGITLVINTRFGMKLSEYQNGFRAIRTETARAIGLTSNQTTIEQEMAIKCLRYGFRVAEIASHEYRRKGGSSKVNITRLVPVYFWNLVCELSKRRNVPPVS